MAQDPHLDILAKGRHDTRTANRIGDLERRVRTLEQGRATIQQIAGTPTTDPRDGTAAVDSVATKLWLRVNGSWRYTTLT